tara:strand:- start:161 stop:523 length:363 start_codon:yes stop_codon:yes gene_type:complete
MYEYQCQSCGFEFEKLQKISDKPLKECPKCERSELQKLVTAAGFQLKGTGWYVTDFKNNTGKKASVKEKNESTGSDKNENSENKGLKSNQNENAKNNTGSKEKEKVDQAKHKSKKVDKQK